MKYAQKEIELITAHYPAHGADVCDRMILRLFGIRRGRNSIIQKAMRLGLRYQGTPRGHFKRGLHPLNKGKKMPPDTYEKVQRTMFRPGNAPHNTKYDGAITIRDRNRLPTLYIRLASGKWKPLAHHLWETHYGPIPPGHVVIHQDGNRMNCEPHNLRLLIRAENMQRNVNREKAGRTMRQIWFDRKRKAINARSFVDAILQGLT